jgi:hypothetical protein
MPLESVLIASSFLSRRSRFFIVRCEPDGGAGGFDRHPFPRPEVWVICPSVKPPLPVVEPFLGKRNEPSGRHAPWRSMSDFSTVFSATLPFREPA